ncbi:PKD domain-containing protein [uncultured Draconibacterium sp.]|uniref:PKD domain-containing protein n=1 Tax=uncultured Draconibacterium sp. TaxID=1573823 RepID=UPI003217F1A3
MILTKPAFLILFVFLLGNAGFAFSKGNEEAPPQIENPISSAIPYCSDSVAVAPYMTVKNISINEASEGMKVSIANYKRGEDKLVWDAVYGFTYYWNDAYGHVEIRGIGTAEQYQEAIRKVYYKNVAEVPTLNIRSFSISLLDADYLPETEHFYRYVSKRGIKWTEARDAADTTKYYGLQGYLVTITSSVENDFVWTKIDGIGWIGANDAAVEGRWQWETGPEKGTHFWQGAYPSGYRVNGRYSNWNSGEPNNVYKTWGDDEDYGHINADPGSVPKSWNDLSNEGDKDNPTGYYYPQGFIVEFGGMPGDPPVKLSASAQVEVRKIAFANQRNFEICEGESLRLNDIGANNSYSYSWSPNEAINNPNVSSPTVKPGSDIVYTARGVLGFCEDTASFHVLVDPVPVSLLPVDTTICKGDSVTLDAGEHAAYLWSTGEATRTITVADEKIYWVRLSNDVPCEIMDTVEVKWSVRPVLDYSTVDTLVCGSKTQTLQLSFVGGTASTHLISFDPLMVEITDEASLTPTITVKAFGKYQFEMQINDEYGCQFLDTLNIEFHNQPEAKILMDEDKCKGYSLELNYGGMTEEDALFSWYYNDTVFQSGVNLQNLIIPLGYGQINRSVGLKVNEQGCVDSSFRGVTVTPNVEIVADITEGCTPLLVEFEAKATEAVLSNYWDFGDGNNSDQRLVTNTFVNPETGDVNFDVSLTVISVEGCENTGIMKDMITAHPKPTVDLSFNEEDCNSSLAEVWYEGSGNNRDEYHWDLNSLQPDEIIQNPGLTSGPLQFNRLLEPTVSLGIKVISEFGCQSDSISKIWKRKPLFEVLVDTTEGCPPLEVAAQAIVSDLVDNVEFSYDLGDGTEGNGSAVSHIYTAAATTNELRFTGTSLITGCSDTVSFEKEIETFPVPVANFSPVPDEVLISDPEIYFENKTVGATDYEWDFDDGSFPSGEFSPTHRFTGMGFYNVLLMSYNDLGCLDSIAKKVAVTFDRLYPPNAFSPNAFAEEDRVFRVYSEGVVDEGYQLLIFNRWGEVIFESASQLVGWDGKMKNDNFAPGGVYTWVLQYTDFTGKAHKQQGNISLVF